MVGPAPLDIGLWDGDEASRSLALQNRANASPHLGHRALDGSHLRQLDGQETYLLASPALVPFVKWPGGKTQELPAIAAAAPSLVGRYVDPFVGGGSVLLAVPCNIEAWANDAASDLIWLYEAAADHGDEFGDVLARLASAWSDLGLLGRFYEALANDFLLGTSGLAALSTSTDQPVLKSTLSSAGEGLSDVFAARLRKDLPSKFERMRRIQREVGRQLSGADLLANVEGAVRSAFYMAIRSRYNRARQNGTRGFRRLADFFFLREFAYAAMFRFNSRGEFNVPYGGITYNRKSFSDKVDALLSPDMVGRLSRTTWRTTDFEDFLGEVAPAGSDFVFVDPPYDSEFSHYDNRSFGSEDQARLQLTLENMSANVMVVIKDTPMIRRLYRPDRWRIAQTDKTYMWTIKSRNDRDAVHLTITNY